MLRHLHIRNYALIRELDAPFGDGLTVITGETGAGKSILLGALGLVLGKRADSKVLFDPGRKCVVEARFDVRRYGLEAFFAEHDLDHEDETLIRREVNASGKSRAFINDTPVRLSVLEGLASRLVHIHSQHETLDLKGSRFQLGVLDALAGNARRLADYRAAYGAWKAERDALRQRREALDKALAERDYLQFQFDELDAAGLDGVDAEAWERELRALEHAEETKRVLLDVTGALAGGAGETPGAAELLQQAASALRGIRRWLPDADAWLERFENLRLETDALASDLERLERETTHDPERIAELESGVDRVNRLLMKHRVQTAAELVALRDELSGKLLGVDTEDRELEALERRVAAAAADLAKRAADLHTRRAKVAPKLEKATAGLLAEVGMPHARLRVELSETGTPGPSGATAVRFAFASNKGSRFEDLGQVASGGELSRLMLCVKRLVAEESDLPTLLFDEIDAGVGGEIGRRIGQMMAELARGHQVIAITHLPQIAACGGRHFFVYKDHGGDASSTHLRALEGVERVEGIARMLSGDDPGKAALANARELLDAAGVDA